MVHEEVQRHIGGLSDAALVEYLLTGTAIYDPEAVAFARWEFERRRLRPEYVEGLRQIIVGQMAQHGQPHPALLARPTSVPVLCQSCGVEAPLRLVCYEQNIGAFVLRFSESRRGYFCKRCNRKHFWKTTLITLVAGWWGVISFFYSFYCLINNIIAFFGTMSLPPPSPGAVPPYLDHAAVARVAPYGHEVLGRLNEGMEINDVSRLIAPRAGITPGQVLVYAADLVHQYAMAAPPPQFPVYGFPVLPVPPSASASAGPPPLPKSAV